METQAGVNLLPLPGVLFFGVRLKIGLKPQDFGAVNFQGVEYSRGIRIAPAQCDGRFGPDGVSLAIGPDPGQVISRKEVVSCTTVVLVASEVA